MSFINIIHLRDGNWPWWLRSTRLKFRASALETLWSRRITLTATKSSILLPT